VYLTRKYVRVFSLCTFPLLLGIYGFLAVRVLRQNGRLIGFEWDERLLLQYVIRLARSRRPTQKGYILENVRFDPFAYVIIYQLVQKIKENPTPRLCTKHEPSFASR
jgi:hypothetical protein